jgi:membrane associated rhomboid family serine protease
MISYLIILVTIVISASALNRREIFYKLQFNAYQVYHYKQWYRIFSHALIHADWNHLIFNMLTLFFFGKFVVDSFGTIFGNLGVIYFFLMYVLAILISSLPSLQKNKNNPSYNAVGASGAVSAVLFSYILLNPLGKIYIFFIPIGIPAIIFGILYLIYSAVMAKKNIDNIGHDAHFWGAVFGFLFPLFLENKLFLLFLSQIFN